MLVVFAALVGGILAGRLLWGWRLAFVSRIITVIIWVLLFLLGLEAGSDPAVTSGFVTLGQTAFVIFSLSVAGSIAMSWLLWQYLRRRSARLVVGKDTSEKKVSGPAGNSAETIVECGGASIQDVEERSDTSLSRWGALRGSLVIVGFFVVGCLAGLFAILPFDIAGSRVSTYVLYALMFCVGVTLGNDTTLVGRIRQLDPRLALLPVMTAVGTLAGAALAAPMVSLAVNDGLAVGAGFGYYSLSSIFIADFRGAELGTVALLCNIMREIFTLLAVPLVARWFGPLAAVSVGGATTADTTLPIITQAAGKPYAVVSIFHGCALDLSVPFLVTLFCSL